MEAGSTTLIATPEFSRRLACAFVCDGNLTIPSAAIATLFANFTNSDVHVFVERSKDCDDPVKEAAHDRVFYHYQRLSNDTYNRLPDHPRCTRATWGRIFVPEILRDYERVLYVDIDTIPSSFSSDITDFPLPEGLGMVRDVGFLDPKSASAHLGKLPEEIAGEMSPDYFNAGVMLIDPANWDADMVHRKLSMFLELGGQFSNLPDQDFLNFAFHGKITELSPNLNFQYPLMLLSVIASGTPSVRHYNSDLKPYHILPKFGASSVLREASDELGALCNLFGLSQAHIKPNRGIRKTRILKGVARHLVQSAGITSRKADRLGEQWQQNRTRALEYLSSAIAEGSFADTFNLPLEFSEIDYSFDGFEILPETGRRN